VSDLGNCVRYCSVQLESCIIGRRTVKATSLIFEESMTAADSKHKTSPRDRILSAARRLFFRHGFSQVTTDMLAREASASKATLYKHFNDKHDILSAVVNGEGGRFWVETETIPRTRDGWLHALLAFGEGFLKLLADPEVRNFERLMISEAHSHPDGAMVFHQRAHQRTLSELTRIIEIGQDKGWVASKHSAEELADALACVWKGMTHARLQLVLEPNPYPDREGQVRRGLDIVLGLEE